jgi:TATA-box binding protein (TBP) (component of TFIID and TFIIIB)
MPQNENSPQLYPSHDTDQHYWHGIIERMHDQGNEHLVFKAGKLLDLIETGRPNLSGQTVSAESYYKLLGEYICSSERNGKPVVPLDSDVISLLVAAAYPQEDASVYNFIISPEKGIYSAA